MEKAFTFDLLTIHGWQRRCQMKHDTARDAIEVARREPTAVGSRRGLYRVRQVGSPGLGRLALL